MIHEILFDRFVVKLINGSFKFETNWLFHDFWCKLIMTTLLTYVGDSPPCVQMSLAYWLELQLTW